MILSFNHFNITFMKKVRSVITILVLTLCLSACAKMPGRDAPLQEDKNIDPELAQWPVYEGEDDKIKFRYRQDLRYMADNEKENEGYDLYVGFSQEDKVAKNRSGSYPIEFVVVTEEKESEYVNGGKYISGFKKGNKFYYFSTYEMDKYGKTVDKMAQSLEFLN